MSKDKKSNRRKNYFIKKGFQIRFILKFCSLVLIGVIMSTGLLFLFSRGTLTSSYQQSRLIIRNTASAILPTTIYINLVILGLITLATIVIILIISHKLAGPLFRFEKELKEIGKGNLTTVISLRKKDQIADLAGSLNNMTDSLRDRVLAIQKEVEHLTETASQVNAPEEIVEQLNQLHQKIVSNFKI